MGGTFTVGYEIDECRTLQRERRLPDWNGSIAQAQGAAKPLHVWPGDSAQELATDFDALLDRIVRTGRIPVEPEAPQA